MHPHQSLPFGRHGVDAGTLASINKKEKPNMNRQFGQ
jgi:hypothetical protein